MHPQWYETHLNVNLGSNGVDWVRSLRKILTRLHGTNICTSSARFPPSFVRQPNSPECTQMIQNTPKHQFGIQWVGSGLFVAKKSDVTSFCTEFRKAAKRSRMHPNGTKRTKTSVWGPMGWIGIVHCEKFRRDFVARTFALVRPVLHRVS